MTKRSSSSLTASKDKLLQDLQMVVTDAEELLRATSSQAGEQVVAARARIQSSLQVVKERLLDSEEALLDYAKQATKVTDEYVHKNPWQAIGVSAAVGALIGMLIARR
ncbi:MAG: DUF883 family protein [Sideroxydans sp.]|jgi:ElaB/YqjD/DUF883 family membrane-anchored ribosome-binding protein